MRRAVHQRAVTKIGSYRNKKGVPKRPRVLKGKTKMSRAEKAAFAEQKAREKAMARLKVKQAQINNNLKIQLLKDELRYQTEIARIKTQQKIRAERRRMFPY